MRAILIFTFFQIYLFQATQAQEKTPVFHPAQPLNHYNLDHWNSESGLNSNNLTSVIQDEIGYLWIGTYNGLLRFDGKNFSLFDSEKIDFLETEAISRSFYNENDGYIFTSQGSGAITLKEGKINEFYLNQLLPSKSIRAIYKEKEDTYWIGTNNLGLFLIEQSQVIQIDHPALKDNSIFDIALGENNELWVATSNIGVVKIKNRKVVATYKVEDGLQSNRVNTVFYSPKYGIVAGTSQGLGILIDNKFQTLHDEWMVTINHIDEDEYHTLWIATERGLMRYHPDYQLNEKVGLQSKIAGLEIIDFIFDKEGSLWLCTSKAGLFRLKQSGIYTINSAVGLSNSLINIIAEGPKQEIYVGNDIGKIDVISDAHIHPLSIQENLSNFRIRDIVFDDKDNIWIATYKGLLKKSGTKERVFDRKNAELPSDDLRRILIQDENTMWLASRSEGVFKLKNDKFEKAFNIGNGIKSNYILALETDNYGDIYIGTHGGGLSIINKSDEVSHFSFREDGNDAGILIFNIHIDDENRVFLVTNIGLFYFDGQGFTKINLSQEIKGETFFDWVEDHHENVWISSNKGIFKLSKAQILASLNQDDLKVNYQLFNTEDGMLTNECTGATRSTLSSDGRVWIPSINGVVVINPAAIPTNKLIPHIDISQLIIDDSTFYLNPNHHNENIKVKAGNLRYTFHFTGLSLFAPSKNKFKYRLDGLDKNWLDVNDSRVAEYTNLAPGTYSFQVIGSNNDELWNEEGIQINFEVLPFYYQTTSFKAAIIFLVIILFFALIKWRTQNIQNQNRKLSKLNTELDKFVYSASHDMRAPLSSILGLVQLMKSEQSQENKDKYLSLIESSVRKLDNFIADIINFSRNTRLELVAEKIDFDNTIEGVFDHITYLDFENKIKKSKKIKGMGEFKTDKTRLDIVLNNLISNAVKYHNLYQENPWIEVNINYTASEARIEIKDNGQGIRKEHQENIFKMFFRANQEKKGSGLGLYIVKEAVEKLGGKISFESEYGQGSTFVVVLPCLN